MNIKKFIISVIAIFAFMYAVDFLFHGVLLKEMYVDTAHLWRTKEDMSGFWYLCIIVHLIFAILAVSLFKIFLTSADKAKLLQYSLEGGVLIGMMIGVLEIAAYIYMPIPFMMVITWFSSKIIYGLGIGGILYVINKNNK